MWLARTQKICNTEDYKKILEYMQEINPVLDIFQFLTSTTKEEIQHSKNTSEPNLEATLVLMLSV